MLKEALEPFCTTMKDLRPALAHPFRQEDCVMASDGHVLIAIKAKEAGVSISKFKEMNDFNAHKAIPQVGSDDLLQARTIERSDLLATIDDMKRLEKERQQVTAGGEVPPDADPRSHEPVRTETDTAQSAWRGNVHGRSGTPQGIGTDHQGVRRTDVWNM